jgi:hypothetical protein
MEVWKMFNPANYDSIPRRIAVELGIMRDCMRFVSINGVEWAFHLRLGVKFPYYEEV